MRAFYSTVKPHYFHVTLAPNSQRFCTVPSPVSQMLAEQPHVIPHIRGAAICSMIIYYSTPHHTCRDTSQHETRLDVLASYESNDTSDILHQHYSTLSVQPINLSTCDG